MVPQNKNYAELVRKAEESVAAVKDPELRKIAFDRILATLLAGDVEVHGEKAVAAAPNSKEVDNSSSASQKLAKFLEKDEERVLEYFDLRNKESVNLKLRPERKQLGKSQRAYAHAVLLAAKVGFGVDYIGSLDLTARARRWDLWDKNFSQNLGVSEFIQSEGTGRGLKYSLKPGATYKIKKEVADLIE